mgnify:CR=1 FL=1
MKDIKFNDKKDWWNQSTDGLHYAEYKVGNKVTVIVGVRPNCYGTTPEVYDSIGAWMNVSDRFIRHRADKLNVFYPWNEGGIPTYETLFGVLKTLHYWIDELEIPRIYIHCDGGTHRAVTLFGLYLLTYRPGEAEEINKSYALKDRQHWSNPLEYARGYFDDIPALREFIEALRTSEDDVSHGHSFDDFLKGIGEETFKKYYRQRAMRKDIPYVWMMLKLNFKWAILNNTIGRIKQLDRWVHKKLNTKKGQALKRARL